MATNALVTTRIDRTIKEEASKVLGSMGLTVSDAMRLMLTKIAREQTFPFDIRNNPNPETVQAMLEARTMTEARFKNATELFNALDSK